jgi:hypothetical protein
MQPGRCIPVNIVHGIRNYPISTILQPYECESSQICNTIVFAIWFVSLRIFQRALYAQQQIESNGRAHNLGTGSIRHWAAVPTSHDCSAFEPECWYNLVYGRCILRL